MNDAPQMIDGAQVVLYSPIDPRHRPTAGCKHVVAGIPQGPAAALAICQYVNDNGYYLFGCDEHWNSITDTGHETVAEAMRQAEFEYPGVWKTWLNHQPAWDFIADDAEEQAAWDLFYEQFHFRPSVYPADWPGIVEPTPSVTYDICHAFANDDGRALTEMNVEMLALFKGVVSPGERLWSLDWQHYCFHFNPFGRFTFSEIYNGMIPVVPDGDYSIFLAEDYSFGTFGHPWELTICAFGEPLLALIERERPAALKQVLRRNGRPV